MYLIKKNAYGFTLIELLGVLIVLVIISLITLPTINDSVEKSKKDSLKISVSSLYDAGKEYSINHYDELLGGYEKIFTINNGSFKDDKMGVKGELPTKGQIGILADGNVAVAINDGKWCAKKDYNDENVIISSDLDNCFITQVFPIYSATSESCFDFDEATGTIYIYHGDDDGIKTNPSCPRNVVIPSTINGIAVTTIGENAFNAYDGYSNGMIESVYIPDSVTTIGDNAFSYINLSLVRLGKNVTSIGNYAFFHNPIKYLTLPNTLVSIGDQAFGSNLIGNLNIPSSVTHIGAAAFNNNMLPDNQAIIYARNADGTIDNTTIVSYGGKNRGDSIVIPNTVQVIGNSAFDMYNWHFRLDNDASNVLITSVTIPDSVITIGDYAFQTTNLNSLTLGNSVTTIGDYAFSGYSEGGSITDLVIPDSVTSIGIAAFYWHMQLSNVTLGNNLISIGTKAFYSCHLSNITIPSSVTTIDDGPIWGDGAFSSNYFNTGSIVTIKYNATNPANRFDGRKDVIGWGVATMQYVSD